MSDDHISAANRESAEEALAAARRCHADGNHERAMRLLNRAIMSLAAICDTSGIAVITGGAGGFGLEIGRRCVAAGVSRARGSTITIIYNHASLRCCR